MADLVKYYFNTDTEILSLTPTHPAWQDRAFYYPEDKTYFYQALDGVMKRYAGGDVSVIGVGCTIDEKVIGGVKQVIYSGETLEVPEDFEYNVSRLSVQGIANVQGTINVSK